MVDLLNEVALVKELSFLVYKRIINNIVGVAYKYFKDY